MKTHTTRAAKERRKGKFKCTKVSSGEHAEGEYKWLDGAVHVITRCMGAEYSPDASTRAKDGEGKYSYVRRLESKASSYLLV